ncbi:MAG TPA: hypothetical protein VGE84_10895 [Allosphingosinicella sp.]
MNGAIKKGIGALMLAATVGAAVTPADAQQFRHFRHHRHHGSDAGLAIGLGIIGLGIGAAIASSGRRYDRYYGDPYYGDGYYRGDYGRGYYDRGYYDRGYYGQGYYGDYYGYGYDRRCYSERRYDPYTGRRYRVRYCD